MTMKAIRTKYIPAGNVKGSRISATTGEKGQHIIMSYDDSLNSSGMHAKAARTLADKMLWPGTLIGGGFPDGTMVWVFSESPDRSEPSVRVFKVTLSGRLRGAIGKHGTEKRNYTVTSTVDRVREYAIQMAHEQGEIEHVRIEKVETV